MNLFRKIRKIFEKKPCGHDRNYTSRQYVEDDTQMSYFRCNDCGWEDRGHVYTMGELVTESVLVRDGKVIVRNGFVGAA